MRKNRDLAIIVAFLVCAFIWILAQPFMESVPSPSIPPGGKKQQSYSERQKQAYEANKALLLPELEPICGPTYEISCFLHSALSRLASAGYEQEAAFNTLILLSETAIKSGDEEIMKKVFDILENLKFSALIERRKLKLAVMKLQFALRNYEAGLKTLEGFRGEPEPFDFTQVPQIVAISFLTQQNDLELANKIAIMTKEWPFASGPPPTTCFGRSTHADSILNLMVANLAFENFDAVLMLMPLVLEKESSYYAERIYYDIAFRLGEYYSKHPDAQNPPKKLCAKLLQDEEKITPYWEPFNALGRMGCQEEKVKVAQKIVSRLKRPTAGDTYHYDEIRMVLGEGEELIKEASLIEDPRRRFEQYLTLARQFHSNNFPVFTKTAMDYAISLYDSTSFGYDNKGADWNGYLIHAYRALGAEEELAVFFNRLIEGAKTTGNERLIKDLGDYLQKSGHPEYEWIAEKADQLWAKENATNSFIKVISEKERDLKIDRIEELAKKNQLEEATALFISLGEEDEKYAYAQLFPTLFRADTKNELFKEAWKREMEGCFKIALMNLDTTEPSILAPYCISMTISQGLGERQAN